jgi:holliday junction DNA helicase RuvA
MIAALRGVLEARSADSLVIEVAGVSFRVFAPASTVSQAGSLGDTVKLYTHLYVREDLLSLFGFQMPQERDLFQLLLTVTGIGPKAALSLLSAYPAETLKQAIAGGDVDLLTRVPGIGKKTAGRLVLDLKGKLDWSKVGLAAPGAPADADVLAALTNLGYTAAEAQAAVQSLPTDRAYTTEEKIRLAFQFFAGR